MPTPILVQFKTRRDWTKGTPFARHEKRRAFEFAQSLADLDLKVRIVDGDTIIWSNTPCLATAHGS
jgi:hypothetical protein